MGYNMDKSSVTLSHQYYEKNKTLVHNNNGGNCHIIWYSLFPSSVPSNRSWYWDWNSRVPHFCGQFILQSQQVKL